MKKYFQIFSSIWIILMAACVGAARAQTPTMDSAVEEQAEVLKLVEEFGRKLKNVALLAPDAADEIRVQYADYVAPALLDAWAKDVSSAPGHLTSSPWPDRIEVASIRRENSGVYAVDGFVIEVTSVEAVGGGEAVRTPVRIVVGRVDGKWRITEYAEIRNP